MGIVSFAFNLCHEKSLRVQRIISLEIEAGAILPAKHLGVNPLAWRWIQNVELYKKDNAFGHVNSRV